MLHTKNKQGIAPYVLCLILFISSSAQAQQGIDYTNIFSLQHNRVGVPKGNQLCIYAIRDEEWTVADSISLPDNYKALDGNIRRVYILMDDSMVFHGFYGETTDSLRFDGDLPSPTQENWIRTPYSTEKDFWVYDNGREVGVMKDGGEWYKVDMHERLSALNNGDNLPPLLSEQAGESVLKLYSFDIHAEDHVVAVHADRITFHRYMLKSDYSEAIQIDFKERYGHPYPTAADMEFSLHDDALTAFVYDRKYIAIVTAIKIQFYSFDLENNTWILDPRIPELYF